ncbi:MAG TPA: sigma-70 family RNA polymerase sigma factor [Opitutales bacterium]|jgi:RNA polymerase sigma-70 factor (ECF subfamily)|nr:sigma-70 family RNA polymerase sigma factor [Opitutales bacterium]
MPSAPAALTGVAALTHRLAKGDEAAFREFHAQYFDRLYQFLLVVARGQEHEAREALQETLVRVARHARPFDDEFAFWCWLKAVARNAARDSGRKRTRYAALMQSFSAFSRPEAPVAPAADDGRLSALLIECLVEFAPGDRALLEGKYLHGATVAELAGQMGQSIKSVESRLVRLRRELRESTLAKLRQP